MNDLTIQQASTLLNAVIQQATGANPTLTNVNTKDVITVAQTVLKQGYDPMTAAISQVLSRTIFSIRPYDKKFRGLEVTAQRWGNHVRKLQAIDGEFEDNEEFKLVDGQSIDMYKVNKPKVLQTNFYGEDTFQKHITMYRNQLDTAFSSVGEFGQFVTMALQNSYDMIAQEDETFDRLALSNFITGKVAGDPTNVRHLVTEYNAYAGTSYTKTTIKDPTAYEPFIKWVYGFIKTLIGKMSERSELYHINITGKAIKRHTPINRLKMYLYAPVMNDITASVLSDLYHDQLLQMAEHETVNYWQNIAQPGSVLATPTYMGTDGALVTASDPVQVNDIFGLIFDEEAIGVNRCNEWSERTPMNAAGGYTNIYWHWTRRYWNDFTENGILLLMD
jgi:hypothetical protein